MIRLLKFCAILFFSSTVFAVGPSLTYHGRLIDPAGVAVTANSVLFKIQIRSPGVEDCLMYEESQTLDMSQSDGVFSLAVNSGAGTRNDSSGFTIPQIFSNRKSLSFVGGQCTSGAVSWTPTSTDLRKIKISFNDGTIGVGNWEDIPALTINYVPTAIDSQRVNGYPSDQILKIADGASTTGTELSSGDWTKLLALIGGTSTQYVTPGSASFSSAPQWSGVPSGANELVNKTYVDNQIAALGSPSGTVNSGTTNQLATYSSNGTAVSGLATANSGVLITSGAGVPSIGTTLPSQVQGNITSVGTVASGTWNGTVIGGTYGGTGVNSSAAANGQLLIGNSAGFTLANLAQSANQGVTITNSSGGIALGTAQDIKTTASPDFAGLILNNSSTQLTQAVSVGTSYQITWPGNVASTSGSVLTSTNTGLLSWQSPSNLTPSLSKLTAAASTNTIDNLNFSQIWNWSTATTQTGLSVSSDSLTSGGILSLSTSSNSLNSTDGILNVKNTGNSINGKFVRFQSNSDSDSGLTVLSNGKIGIGTQSPEELLSVIANDTSTRVRVSNGQSTSVAQYPGFEAVNYMGAVNQGYPKFVSINYRGPGGTPAAVNSGDILGSIEGWGGKNNSYSVNNSGKIQFIATENFSNTNGGGLLSFQTTTNGDTIPSEKMTIGNNGYVNIGAGVAAGTRLKVSGQLVTGSNSISTASVDFNKGNAITTSYDCAGNISFVNLDDGGSYTLVVTGTGTAQCNFNTAVTGDDAGTVTYKYKPDNGVRTATSHTVYSLIRVGTVVYVSWISGF